MENFIKKLKSLRDDVTLGKVRKELMREALINYIREGDDVEKVEEVIKMRKNFNGEPGRIRKSDNASETERLVGKRRKIKK